MGVHVQLSGELLQALMDGFSVPFSPTLVGCLIGAFCCFCFSLPPSLAYHAKAAFLAVACTVLGICMTVISAGIQYRATNSADGLSDGPPAVSLWPKPVASLQSIMVAFLNIAFALVSQITFPSFIAEMKEPRYPCIDVPFVNLLSC